MVSQVYHRQDTNIMNIIIYTNSFPTNNLFIIHSMYKTATNIESLTPPR